MYPYGWILESWSCVLHPALAAGVVALDAQCSSFPFGPDTRRGSRTLSTLDSSNFPAGLRVSACTEYVCLLGVGAVAGAGTD